MVDGWYVGMGGGNYFVFGGVMLVDSLFLCCFDLFVSLIVYWYNYLLLLYLFLGLFIGLMSQVLWVDEVCNDQFYEFDIVFVEIQCNKLLFGQDMLLWFVDCVLCNLLIDVMGNMYCSEFCIDKLYLFDLFIGWFGLFELCVFEMLLYVWMSIVQ